MIPNRHQRRHPEMYGFMFVNDNDDTGAGGGGSNVAVLEREEGTAEPGDDAGDEEAAAAADAEDDEDAKADAPDPTIEALREAAKAEGRHEAETEREQAEREKAEEAAKTARTEALKALRTNRDADIANIPVRHTDDDGNEVTSKLSDFAIGKAVLAAIEKHDPDLEEHFGLGFREAQDVNMLALLPADAHEATQKALDDAADYKAHAQAFGEAYAKHAKVIKEMGLDDLAKLSPKANRELKERELAKEKAGRLKGQGDPVDEPRIGGTPAAGKDPSYAELQKMTDAQLNALPPGVQARVIAKAVKEGN